MLVNQDLTTPRYLEKEKLVGIYYPILKPTVHMAINFS